MIKCCKYYVKLKMYKQFKKHKKYFVELKILKFYAKLEKLKNTN